MENEKKIVKMKSNDKTFQERRNVSSLKKERTKKDLKARKKKESNFLTWPIHVEINLIKLTLFFKDPIHITYNDSYIRLQQNSLSFDKNFIYYIRKGYKESISEVYTQISSQSVFLKKDSSSYEITKDTGNENILYFSIHVRNVRINIKMILYA